MQQEKIYIDEREVFRLTGRALSTLRNDRHRGRGIPYCKVGRSVRYLVQDVIDFMESHKIQTERNF
jgi:predicted DNA-binding transcriptional regulator AlpA